MRTKNYDNDVEGLRKLITERVSVRVTISTRSPSGPGAILSIMVGFKVLRLREVRLAQSRKRRVRMLITLADVFMPNYG